MASALLVRSSSAQLRRNIPDATSALRQLAREDCPLSCGRGRGLASSSSSSYLLDDDEDSSSTTTTTTAKASGAPKQRSSLVGPPSSSQANKHYQDQQPLIRLDNASLGYENDGSILSALNWSIGPAPTGGHALLGANGTGKSLLCRALVEAAAAKQHRTRQGTAQSDHGKGRPDRHYGGCMETSRYLGKIQQVSFDSHHDLLQARNHHDDTPLTAYGAICDGANLSAAAQFLVIRFGLLPLLYRDVTTLSTGEIRKTLLIRALAANPKLLLLDNAFDGLDVPSRRVLQGLVRKTLQGFAPDILVQGVSAKSTSHTQMVLVTHRVEELVLPEMQHISYLDQDGHLQTHSNVAEDRLPDIWRAAIGTTTTAHVNDEPWKSPNLPSVDSMAAWWQQSSSSSSSSKKRCSSSRGEPLVQTQQLRLQRGDAILLQPLDWTIGAGERWLVAGHNGSGKSTLSRLLAQEQSADHDGHLRVINRRQVAAVSTESHMALTHADIATRNVVTADSAIDLAVAYTVLEWLFDARNVAQLLDRPFCQLSQGEQKLMLIAAAVARRPALLILDEPCQGLDEHARWRMLGVVERLCQATTMCHENALSLVYITHHYEEVMPAVQHVLHLRQGHVVYQGNRAHYDPHAMMLDDDDVYDQRAGMTAEF